MQKPIERPPSAPAKPKPGPAAPLALTVNGKPFEHSDDPEMPLLHEHYYLVCLKEALDAPPIATLRRLLQDERWQRELAALPGYAPWRSGEVLSLKTELPWWKLPPKRVRSLS